MKNIPTSLGYGAALNASLQVNGKGILSLDAVRFVLAVLSGVVGIA